MTATDPDAGQTLELLDHWWRGREQIHDRLFDGALSFITAPNFEAPTDAGGNNVYDVIVQASDGHGGIDTQAIAVGVQNVVEAPALVPTHNFNGDGKADILWQNDSGLPAIWLMDGMNPIAAAAVGPIRGQAGTSRTPATSTATASPTSCGRTTTDRPASG